jgi:hypothetical protein
MLARERVLSMINSAWMCQAIATACELDLFDHIADGHETVDALSSVARADAGSVYRLLRALTTLDLCEERGNGTFALSADGALLRREAESGLHYWARMSGRRSWTNWAGLADCVRAGSSVRKRLFGGEDFTALNKDPTGAAIFNRAMADLTRPVALAAAQKLNWSGFKRVVDVGGGPGELVATLLEQHAHLHGVVFDLEHAVVPALERMRRAGLAERCEIVAGSFFESVPTGDAYLLKSVLHNWDDARALDILKACGRSIAADGVVFLFERIAPERYSSSAADRDVARSDLNMLVGCDGRERTEAQFRVLLENAGFALQRTQFLAASVSALLATRIASSARRL